jgi:hypothetical protein
MNSLVDYFNVKTHDIREGNITTWNLEHPFPRVSGYKRGSDITEVRVHSKPLTLPCFRYTYERVGRVGRQVLRVR